MVKHKVLLVISILALTLAIMASSCAPAAAPAKPAEQQKPAATAPAAPAAKPADTAPTAAAGPTIKTSFESATFTDSTNGFSFQYPKAWVKDELVLTEVANFAKASNPLGDHVAAFINPEAKNIPADFKTTYENTPGMKQYGAIVNIESSGAIKLADGKTDAVEMVGISTILSTYNLWSYAIGFNKGGKTIIVAAYTFGDTKDLLKEIVKTTVVK